MLYKIMSTLLVLSLTIAAHAADPKTMSACLPDRMGDFKAGDAAAVTRHKDKVTSVSRPYQSEKNQPVLTVSVWKIPGNKQIWPYIDDQGQAQIIVISGRLCILKHDPATLQSTLVVNIDKGYLSPPPFLYRVSILAKGKKSDETAKALAEKLNFDRLFALYDK